MKNVSKILMATTLLSVVACGNKTTSSSKKQSQDLLLTEAGKYEAKLSPINAHLAGDVSGSAIVRVKGDTFTAEVKVDGSPSQVIHAQSIHVADECPTLSSDINKDGVIDAQEGLKAYGDVVIPLDGQLKTQIEKEAAYPTADFSGNYYYKQTASMMEMLMDLASKDLDPNDHVAKLRSSFGLVGRQIVIYGVAKDANLPETVAAMKGKSKHSSLPIACGSFVKVADDVDGSNTDGGKDP